MTDSPVDLDELERAALATDEAYRCGSGDNLRAKLSWLRSLLPPKTVLALIAEVREVRGASRTAPPADLHQAWGQGYTHGYDDREKMDHDRADVVRTENPYPIGAPSADHEPFSPMECCGRERDKDGGRNSHCECQAPLKRPPVDLRGPACAMCGRSISAQALRLIDATGCADPRDRERRGDEFVAECSECAARLQSECAESGGHLIGRWNGFCSFCGYRKEGSST